MVHDVLELKGVRLADDASPLHHSFRGGSICVVLGRNHSGKTRLCRMLSGLDPIGAGSLLLDGQDIGRLPPQRRPVALVFQSFVNYPNLTVADNIASPLRARRVARNTITERVRALAEQMRIDDLLGRHPHQLSGGQQQRVAIARALAKDARVLVMDEPLVNLDFKLRESLEVELRDLLHREQRIVVYATSDPRDAFNLGDDVLLLNDHQMVQAGPPLDVYEHPATVEAADLMSDPGVNRWQESGMLYCVRPEQLAVTSSGADEVSFSGEPLSAETNGSETYLHCRVRGEHWVARLDGLPDQLPLPSAEKWAGASLSLYAPRQAVHAFAGELRSG